VSIKAALNSGFAKKRVQWLIEHSTSHQILWYVDSFVLRNPLLRKAAKRWLLCKMAKPLTILFFVILGSTKAVGQSNNIAQRVDSLQYLKQQPFPCNSIYWRVVATGKDAIPFLIDKLDDTTHTQISLTCKATNVKFGDICFEALTEIFNIPLFYVTHQQFDFIDQYGCQQGVFTYLKNNRQKFKSQILAYYDKYKTELVFIQYDKEYKNDCKRKNKILGYFDIDWKLLDKN
jgi:hypothetical protein